MLPLGEQTIVQLSSSPSQLLSTEEQKTLTRKCSESTVATCYMS